MAAENNAFQVKLEPKIYKNFVKFHTGRAQTRGAAERSQVENEKE